MLSELNSEGDDVTVETLTSVDALEDRVGARPPVFHLKSIRYLDEHCHTLLAASPFAVIGLAARDGSLCTVAVGGDPGVLAVTGRTELTLPTLDRLDVPDGTAIGVLSFMPGYRETLRVNGRLRTGRRRVLEVEEAFLHCAKAVIRSGLWDPARPPTLKAVAEDGGELSMPGVAAFFEGCPFVTLASCDDGGAADVSPKGDPAGLLVQVLDDRRLAIADRPGNRRTDTMHNLMTHDALSLLAFIPGDERVIEVRGRGAVTTNEGVRSGLAVNGKVPKAALVLTTEHLEVRREPAIAAAGLWDVSRHVDPGRLPRSTQIWVDHVKRNDDKGLAASAARLAVNVPMLDLGISKDYRDNLY